MNNIDEIKARIDIVDLVQETVQLRRSGHNYTGFCPFHDNKRSPAFAVFPDSGTWRCFGQCNEGGDIFKFMMKKEGWEFVEALRYLADRAGVQLQQFTPEQEAQREEHERLRELLEDSVAFFRHQLLKTKAGEPALKYLLDRGITLETIETWGLGFAPNSWDECIKYLSERNYSLDDMIEAGMVTKREDGKTWDRFRNRVTFAIRDERGRMAGFGARTLEKDGIPKYLNSPQSVLFDKSHILYGLDQARRSIRADEQAVIVEGYMDVIAVHQAGFTNAVSPMGTALTEHQLRLLKSRTKQIVLALDADAAGNRATLRGLQIARETLDRETEIGFDPRGLLMQEARLQADLRIATLPEGEDPDEVVNRDPEEWRNILKSARPVVAHVMDTLAEGQDLDDPKVKTGIANQVMPLINDLPSAIERSTYVQRLARLLRVDERALLVDTSPAQSRPFRTSGTRQPRTSAPQRRYTSDQASPVTALPGSSSQGLEEFCLGVMMRHPQFVFRVDRALRRAGLGRLAAADFQDSGHQSMMKVILEAVDQDFDVPEQVVIGSLPLHLHNQADTILSKTHQLPDNEVRLLEELLRALLDLRRRGLSERIAHLRYLMEDAQERGDVLIGDHMKTMQQHLTTQRLIDKALQQTYDRTILNG